MVRRDILGLRLTPPLQSCPSRDLAALFRRKRFGTCWTALCAAQATQLNGGFVFPRIFGRDLRVGVRYLSRQTCCWRANVPTGTPSSRRCMCFWNAPLGGRRDAQRRCL